MPFMQFKMYKDALRKDMPVYLYDEGVQYPIKVSSKLKKRALKKCIFSRAAILHGKAKRRERKFLLTNKKASGILAARFLIF